MTYSTADPVAEIDEYLRICGLDPADLGIVIGPQLSEDVDGVCVEVNVRVLEDEDADIYAIDTIYLYEHVGWEEFLDEEYTPLLERFEAEFGDAQLQYFER